VIGRRSLGTLDASPGRAQSPSCLGMSPMVSKTPRHSTVAKPLSQRVAPVAFRPSARTACAEAQIASPKSARQSRPRISWPQPQTTRPKSARQSSGQVGGCGVLVLNPESVQEEFDGLHDRLEKLLCEQHEIKRSQENMEQLLRATMSPGGFGHP